MLKRNDGEQFLQSLMPFMRNGRQIFERAGINAEAPKIKLRYLIGKEAVHKNRADRITALLGTIEHSLRSTPYNTFEREFLIETQNGNRVRDIRQSLGARLSLPPLVLDIYLAQFFGSIFVGNKLMGYRTTLGESTTKERGEMPEAGMEDESFAHMDWAMLIDRRFPQSPADEREEVLEQLNVLDFTEEKVVRAIEIISEIAGAEHSEIAWRMFRSLVLMNLSDLPPNVLNKLKVDLN